MTHKIAVGWQFELQRRLGRFGTQRQFVAFDGQARVQIAIEVDVEFMRRKQELAAGTVKSVQLDFHHWLIAHAAYSP